MEDLRLGLIPHDRQKNARKPSTLFLSIQASVSAHPTNLEPLS